jgi:hypothetical protein
VGRPRTYHCDLGTIEHLSISPHLYFGFVSGSGELTATPEKAFLDVCYFTYRGRRFSFDPASDIDLERLDFDIIATYLQSYDARFVSFFNSIWKKQHAWNQSPEQKSVIQSTQNACGIIPAVQSGLGKVGINPTATEGIGNDNPDSQSKMV